VFQEAAEGELPLPQAPSGARHRPDHHPLRTRKSPFLPNHSLSMGR